MVRHLVRFFSLRVAAGRLGPWLQQSVVRRVLIGQRDLIPPRHVFPRVRRVAATVLRPANMCDNPFNMRPADQRPSKQGAKTINLNVIYR